MLVDENRDSTHDGVLSVTAWLRKLSRRLLPPSLASPLWDYFLFARHSGTTPGEADDQMRISASCLLLGLSLSKEFVVVLPVALDFDHDALEFGISAQLVPVLVALKPGEVMISNLNGPSQPGESRLFFA
jgi:hypothetical protein